MFLLPRLDMHCEHDLTNLVTRRSKNYCTVYCTYGEDEVGEMR
jgi:hypothetical protein